MLLLTWPTGRFAWMLVSTGVLKQVGEDRVAHTKFSPIYTNNVPQGLFFKIMYAILTTFAGP